MFAFVLVALLAHAGASSASPAPQPQASSGPLREVVYRFSDNETQEFTSDQSSGSLAAPPQSSTSTGGYSGTMTVDIVQVDPNSNYIKAEMHEQTNAENGKNPFDAVFVVHPDGGLAIVSGNYDPDMTSLMPYFATQYFAAHDPLQQGMQWVDESTFDQGQPDQMQLETTSTVTSVNGDNASIKAETKVPHVHNGSLTVETNLLYNAKKLVPITLDILATRRGMGTTSDAEQLSHYHFDRVSDTLDH